MAPGDRFLLWVQRAVAWCAFVPAQLLQRFFLRFAFGYGVESIEAVRRGYAEFVESARGRPVLICGNHLTLIDSLIQSWALGSVPYLLARPSRFPWSLPEHRNFYRDPGRAFLSYLQRGVPVLRGGSPERTERSFRKLSHLLSRGETISIFPEGGRSRTGRVSMEPGSYAVGRLLQLHPEALVLCVYLRGRSQSVATDYPARGERFTVRLEAFEPERRGRGLRQRRDLSRQVLARLAGMERELLGAIDADR